MSIPSIASSLSYLSNGHPVPPSPSSRLPTFPSSPILAPTPSSVPLSPTSPLPSFPVLERRSSERKKSISRTLDKSNFITNSTVFDIRITRIRPLLPPACLLEEMPLSSAAQQFIFHSRRDIIDVIHQRDDRLLVVVGPCSIHDVKAAMEYATKLRSLIPVYIDHLVIVMRVYFEKPRTTVGWKGLINDPNLDGTYQINTGIRVARQLMVDINALGVPVGSEFLDTISPEYIADLVSWGAIGARTTESQLHREMVSGLSCPIGFKNGTTGNTKIAVDAIIASASPHAFLGVTWTGVAAIVETKGNPDCHIVLRGSDSGPNYSPTHIAETVTQLEKSKCSTSVMVDCSHGNSSKKYENQVEVVGHVAAQIAGGNDNIIGVMIESNLVAGAQTLKAGMKLKDLVYGQSITDSCVDFETTERLLRQLAEAVEARRNGKPDD